MSPTTTIAEAARRAGIVDGASGAARPLDQRLVWAAREKVRAVIVAAVDGEPLVATQRRLAALETVALGRGLAAIVKAVGARRGVVAVERRARELAAPLASAGLEVVQIPDVARCGDAADLAYDVLGRADGALVVDASAAIELARGKAVTDRAVTVAGHVLRPGVRNVPLGARIADVVAAAGGSTCGVAWVPLGDGPLSGRVLDRDDVVTKATRAIVVLPARADAVRRIAAPLADHVRRSLSACEPCAMCSDVCPPRLLGGRLRPHELVRALGRADAGLDEVTAAVDCTSCGLCDVACPSGLSPRRLVEATARAVLDRLTPEPRSRGAPHELRGDRRLSLPLVALRLGLGDRELDPPWDSSLLRSDEVALPFKQSLGVAARPTVAPGDRVERGALVADVPEGALGVPVHASIAGTVTEVAYGAVVIRADATA
jgi:Na+-translocating ferredoxin:NAD+ oxidoreductase RnfC subunit